MTSLPFAYEVDPSPTVTLCCSTKYLQFLSFRLPQQVYTGRNTLPLSEIKTTGFLTLLTKSVQPPPDILQSPAFRLLQHLITYNTLPLIQQFHFLNQQTKAHFQSGKSARLIPPLEQRIPPSYSHAYSNESAKVGDQHPTHISIDQHGLNEYMVTNIVPIQQSP